MARLVAVSSVARVIAVVIRASTRSVLARQCLNWQHQRYVEPAMNAYYGHGLTDMYRRTRGYHAGGPEQTGFAAGGMTEIDATGKVADKRLARIIAAMMKRWKFALTAAGEAGHASNSDHHWGGAIDIIPGAGGSWSMLDKLARAAGWKPNRRCLLVARSAGSAGTQKQATARVITSTCHGRRMARSQVRVARPSKRSSELLSPVLNRSRILRKQRLISCARLPTRSLTIPVAARQGTR